MIRKENGTGYDMEVTFKYGDSEFKVDVEIPFDTFIEAVRRFTESRKSVGLDGTDTSIWNLLVEMEGLDFYADQEDFLDICREIYYKSSQFEDDLEEWVDDYEYDHEIGKYVPKKEEEK